jgi:thiol-disulfide isomerase/thioredoxin
MAALSQHRVLVAGLLSPFAAVALDKFVYRILTWHSVDPEHDWRFRVFCAIASMTLPFFFTLFLAIYERHNRGALLRSAQLGLALAIFSLALITRPLSGAIARSAQAHNEALQSVPAPLFDTADIFGHERRLADERGKVVLVNIWATWCGPCRAEMPELDALYKSRRDQGLVVFGISNEATAEQRAFLEEVPVSYPLLTLDGQVPSLYRDIVRYPGIFLIDRQGRLQRAPEPNEPFEKLQAAVDALLNNQS